MPDPPYEIGDLVRLTAAFTDGETGLPLVPSSFVCLVKTPIGSVASYVYAGASSPTQIGSGAFKLDHLVQNIGSHQVRWVATGPMTAEEFSFSTVATTRFP